MGVVQQPGCVVIGPGSALNRDNIVCSCQANVKHFFSKPPNLGGRNPLVLRTWRYFGGTGSRRKEESYVLRDIKQVGVWKRLTWRGRRERRSGR